MKDITDKNHASTQPVKLVEGKTYLYQYRDDNKIRAVFAGTAEFTVDGEVRVSYSFDFEERQSDGWCESCQENHRSSGVSFGAQGLHRVTEVTDGPA